MNLRLAVSAIPYVYLFFSLVSFSTGVVGQDEARNGATKTPESFEKGEGGSFQRKRMDWEYKQRAYPRKRIPSGARLNALRQLDAKLAKEAEARSRTGKGALGPQNSAWTLIGPEPEENVFWGPNSGRVAAVVVDPTNTNIVYAGAAQGGVWKTTDGGVTWTPLTDQQASLATGSLALDPQNHLTIYAGTGEENNSGDSYYGAGILKSTDGGSTWTNIPGPFAGGGGGGARIGGIAVSPANSSVVLAAVGCCPPNGWGVYRSADAGNTWTQVLNLNSQAYNVIFDPANSSTAYASIDNNGVYKSTNGGTTWTAANGSGSSTLPTGGSTGRVALAMDPNATSTLYAGITDNNTSGLVGTYKTTDGGNTWTQLTNAPNYCGGQCWYDNVIAVMPGNSNVIYAGGDGRTPVTVSIDGGNTWTNLNNLGIHPDLHALVFTPNGQQLYIGNDGGMYSATNPASTQPTISNLNSQLATLQFYSGPSINPNNANAGFGGTQDNLTNEYSGSLGWQDVDCGDGGNTVIDFTNANNVYVNCILMSLDKSTDGGAHFSSALNGINTSDPVNWVPPLIMDPSNAQRLYFGTNHVYQTTNGAGLWSAISPDLTGGNGNQLYALAVAPTDPNTIYAGSTDVRLHVTTNALAGGSATWTDISGSGSLPNRSITAMAVDPGVATTAYVTFTGFSGFGDSLGHVFMTTNTGTSWSDISGDLPNIPVNTIVVDPVAPGTIYVGTDIGTFYTTNTGVSWGTLGTGLPRVADYGMAYQAATRTLWVATHGRSIWALNVAGLPAIPGITSLVPPSVLAGSSDLKLTINGTGFVSNSIAVWSNGTTLSTTFVSNTQLTAIVPAAFLITGGTFPVFVATPGGAISNGFNLLVNNPIPSLISLVPNSATAGGPAFTLTVNGNNFVSGSQVLWNGAGLTTTFVNSGQVTASVPASDIAKAGTAQVSVSNPAPGGGVSGTLPFTIVNPSPTLTGMTPTSKTAGGPQFTLTVKGTNFVSGAVVQWNGSNRTTKFVKSTEVTATITASDIAHAGTFPVTVTNPGSAASNALTFTVKNPKPKLTTLSPSSATHGGPAFTLTVNGSNFVQGTVVNWNGSARSTTYVSTTKVTAQILAGDIAKAGKAKVTVTNPTPGGGTSNSLTFTIN